MSSEVLRDIVEKVNAAPDLSSALEIVVTEVKAVMAVDVCSVYLRDFERDEFVLMATDGLRKSAVGKVRMRSDQGLVGLVAERSEAVNLEEATGHPRYLFLAETGEERFHGFLGVPVLRHRRVIGVLVVRQRALRQFVEEEVDLLLTLAWRLADAIGHVETLSEVIALREEPTGSNRPLFGLAGAPGVATGKVLVVYPPADLDSVPERAPNHVGQEIAHFQQVVQKVRDEVAALGRDVGSRLGAEERALFDAYAAMVSSDSLVQGTIDRILSGQWAPSALRDTVREHVAAFEAISDPYLRERASDVRDLGRLLLTHLQAGNQGQREYPARTVLVGEEITAVQLAQVPADRCVGVISAHGSGFSHVAILCRAMGVPAVMGVEDLPVAQLEGSEVVVDGYAGRVYVSPSRAILADFDELAREEAALSEELSRDRHAPAETTDGARISVSINAGLQAESVNLMDSGAEGVGLYRTEFPFLVRDRFPGEEEQYRLYRQVLTMCHPAKANLRTLDVGGDKVLPYLPISEANPFLGWRGVRVTLDHPDIFIIQLRAMLRANAGLGNLQIMFPMISGVTELDECLTLLARARNELIEEYGSVEPYEVGVMIEVPSAVYAIDRLAQRVDFISIGTNDLTQYLLAVDRNNERVAELYDHLHPAVLRAIELIVDGAHRYGRQVSVCGEMAEDPVAVLMLIGLGVDRLSVSAASVARIKHVIRRANRQNAVDLLQEMYRQDDAGTIRFLLAGAIEELGLGGLVRAGR